MQEKLNNLSKIALDVLKSSREKLIFICSDENAFCVNEINSLINHTNKNSCTVYAVFVSISSDDPDFFELEQEDFDKIKNSPGLFQKAYTQWLDGNFNGINKLFGRGAEGDATGDGAEGDATGDGAEGDATGDGAEGDATGDGAEGDATGDGAEGDATGDGAEGDATGNGAEGDATGDGAEGDATGDGAEGDATGNGAEGDETKKNKQKHNNKKK